MEPTRRIEGQGTRLSRTMHGIAYDEIHDEIVVPQQFGQAVLIFRGGAQGEEAPIRMIQGPLTQLRRPDRVAVDPVHNEIFIGDGSVIFTFPREADGNVAPIRTIRGPDTQLGTGGGAPALGVDPVHDVLVLASADKILIFNRTDDGNVKPRGVIRGSKTGLRGGRSLAVYPQRGQIVVDSNSREEGVDTFVGVWSVNDNGNVPPGWKFGQKELKLVRGLAVNPTDKTVLVTDRELNRVLTYYIPEIF